MKVNWQVVPETQASLEDAQAFRDEMKSKFGGDVSRWSKSLLAILHDGEQVLCVAPGGWGRLHDAATSAISIGDGGSKFVIATNVRLIWLEGPYLFWSYSNIASLRPITRGHLRFTMRDGSKVYVAFATWMLRVKRLRKLSAVLEEQVRLH
jgi:hypothetical protein